MNSMSGGSSYRGSRGATHRGDVIPKGYRGGQIQNYDENQLRLFERTFGLVSPDSYLSRLSQGDEELFEEMEAPAHRQFTEALGGIASKFSGAGSFGARRSSGFQNKTSAAASQFAQDLASRRSELQRTATRDLADISQMLLGQRPTEQLLVKKQEKEPTNWSGIIGAGVGAAGGFFAGGPAGAATGASAGYKFGSEF